MVMYETMIDHGVLHKSRRRCSNICLPTGILVEAVSTE